MVKDFNSLNELEAIVVIVRGIEKMTVKELIVQKINDHQGIKATELVVNIISEFGEIESNDYDNALAELINDKEIIEVEYTLPSMDYRVKSLYFPKETVIVVSGGN